MSEELKRMRQRHGTYTQMTSQESLPNEFLIVDSGDEATQDGEALYYVTSNNERKRLVTADEGVPADSVDTDQILDGAVTADKIGSGEIKERHIGTGAVTSTKIHSGAVIQGKLGVGAVQTANIDGGAVTNDKIDNRTITGDKLALATVDTSELANYAVDTMKLKSPCVNTAKLYDNAVTADKILDGEVKQNKLADNSVNENKIQNGAVSYNKLSCATTSGNASQAWAFANDTTIPTTKLTKTWIENNVDDKVINGKYSVGFNADGSIKQAVNVTGFSTLISGCTSVYAASKVTTITEQFGRNGVNPNLTNLYIDNEEGVVDIHSSILNDSNITIYYKDEFSIIDLIIETLMATVSVISQVNTQLENAINGVSE